MLRSTFILANPSDDVFGRSPTREMPIKRDVRSTPIAGLTGVGMLKRHVRNRVNSSHATCRKMFHKGFGVLEA